MSANAFAGPDSIVPGGQDPESPDAGFAQKSVDLWTVVDYEYELDSATLVREVVDPMRDPLDGTRTVQDLKFKQFRHKITPRLEIGVFRDTFVTAALPIVINQARELHWID